MAYRQTTWGELMDWANQTDDTASKDFLRKAFQRFCTTHNLEPFSAVTVAQWRAMRVTIGIGDNMPKVLEDRVK